MKTTITKGLQSAALALVVLLGAILPATSQTLTMTTAKKVGDKIRVYLTPQTNELTITGVEEKPMAGYFSYTLKDQTVTFKGGIRNFECSGQELTAITLDKMSGLTSLVVDNNQLATLDVTQCSDLVNLDCHTNKLTSLNFAECKSLGDLECSNNLLTELSFSGNESLDWLDCSKNKLTTLDLSKLERISWLDCSANQLAKLDVSASEMLATLRCSSNKMTELNVEDCDNLAFIYCPDNLLSCSAMETIADQVAVKRDDPAEIYVVTRDEKSVEPGKGNVFTTHAAEIVKAKNWKVYSDVGVSLYEKTEYAGREGSCKEGEITFKVSAEENAKGTVTIKGADNLNAVKYGTELTVEAKPNEHYRLLSIMAGDLEITESKTFTVKESVVVKAVFVEETFKVTTAPMTNGSISFVGPEDMDLDLNNVPYNTELRVMINANEGYELESLKANDEDITESRKFVVKGEVTVTALFRTPAGNVVESTIALFPNPAQTNMVLRGAAPFSEVVVYSLEGAQLLSATADEAGNAHINVATLANGQYLVSVRDNDNKLHSELVTVKR